MTLYTFTGLPELPEGQLWRVTRAHGYGAYDLFIKLKVRKFGIWWTAGRSLIDSKEILGITGWGWAARGVLSDRAARAARETRFRRAAKKRNIKKAKLAATEHLLGDYPPKTIGERK